MAAAISPLEYAIAALSPELPAIERQDMLDAILRQISRRPRTEHTRLVKAIHLKLPEIGMTDIRAALRDAGRQEEAARREAGRQASGNGNPVHVNGSRRYYLTNNRIVRGSSRDTVAGCITVENQVSNFHLHFETERLVDDGERRADGTTIAERQLRGQMLGDGFTKSFSIDSSAFGSNAELAKRITATAGTRALFITNDMDDIRLISSVVSGELKREHIYSFFGHHPTEGFLTPTLTIKDGEIVLTADTDARVEIGQDYPKARRLDLLPALDDEVREMIRHLVTDYWRLKPLRVMLPIFAHAFVGPLLFCSRFQQQGFSPFSLLIIGSSGEGKTEAARLAQCLWGYFGTKEQLASWASTPLSIRQQAAKCRGGLFVIDDFKRHRLQGQFQNAVNLLNDYADLQGRGRATPGARMITQEPIRNMLMVTGEDLPYTETSALARSLIVEFVSDSDTHEQYSQCLAQMGRYPIVMPKFIAWWQQQAQETWLRRAEEERGAFIDFFARERLKGENTVRLASSAALSITAMGAFQTFCSSMDVDIAEIARIDPLIEYRLILQAMCRSMLATVNEIRPSAQFIDALVDLLVSGRVAITDSEQQLQLVPDHNAKTIGHYDLRRGTVNLYAKPALAEIQDLYRRSDGNGMQWSAQAIGKQLADDGWLQVRDKESYQIVVKVTGQECEPVTRRAWALDATRLKNELDSYR